MSNSKMASGSTGQRKQHPLLLPIVLESVFNVSQDNELSWSIQDLKNFRLVCKSWNEILLPRWRSSATLRLLHKHKKVEYDDKIKGIFASDFAKYLLDANDTFQFRRKPFSKYKLIKWKVDGTDFGFKSTWNTVGSYVVCLILDDCTFYDFASHLFKHMIYDRSPRLKQLILESCDLVAEECKAEYYDVSDSDEETVVHGTKDLKLFKLLRTARNPNIEDLQVTAWMPFLRSEADFIPDMNNFQYGAFLKTFPNLKSLKVVELETEYLAYGDRDLEGLASSEHNMWLRYVELNNFLLEWAKAVDGNNIKPPPNDLFPNQLRSLDVMHWNMSPDSKMLLCVPMALALDFPLESLSVSLSEGEHIQILVYTLLDNYKNTLKTVKIFVPPFFRPSGGHKPFGYPLQIEELELWGNVYESFTFLLEMPQLKKLRMDYGCYDKRKYMKWSYKERPIYPVKLDQFSVLNPRDYPKMLEFKLEHLTEFYIDLRFTLKEMILLTPWMPNLKSFKGFLDNHTFRLVCEKWRKLKEVVLLFGNEVDDVGITGIQKKGKRLPNILWFNDLKHFTLQSYCGKGKLTDLSSQEGFLKMNLHSLDVCVSSDFSEEEEKKLNEVIYQVKVRRNFGKHDEDECCRRLEFKKKALVPRQEGVARERYQYIRKEDLVVAGSRM